MVVDQHVPTENDYLVSIITVPVSSLFVDHRYQRAVSKTRVKYLVENWSWRRY